MQIYSYHSLTISLIRDYLTSRHPSFCSTQRCRLWICIKFPVQWYLNIFIRKQSSHWLSTVSLFSLDPAVQALGDLNEVCCVEMVLRREGASSTHHTLQNSEFNQVDEEHQPFPLPVFFSDAALCGKSFLKTVLIPSTDIVRGKMAFADPNRAINNIVVS